MAPIHTSTKSPIIIKSGMKKLVVIFLNRDAISILFVKANVNVILININSTILQRYS